MCCVHCSYGTCVHFCFEWGNASVFVPPLSLFVYNWANWTINVKAYFPFSWKIQLYSKCQTYFLVHLSQEQSACKVSFMSRHLQVSVYFTCVLTSPLTPSSSYSRAALLHKKDTNLYLLFKEKHSFIILCCLLKKKSYYFIYADRLLWIFP